jgi:hypothetical protein
MSDVLTQATLHTDAEYEATLAQIFSEMQSLNEQMQSDQADIERLRAEAMIYKAESQRLKEEGRLLHADNQTRLSRLGVMLDRLAGAT